MSRVQYFVHNSAYPMYTIKSWYFIHHSYVLKPFEFSNVQHALCIENNSWYIWKPFIFQEEKCIAGLRTALVEKCSSHGSDSTNQLLRDILGNESKHVGLLISERLVNLPPQFSLPVFMSLRWVLYYKAKFCVPHVVSDLPGLCLIRAHVLQQPPLRCICL